MISEKSPTEMEKIQEKEQGQGQDMFGGSTATSAGKGDGILLSEKEEVDDSSKAELNDAKLDDGPSDLDLDSDSDSYFTRIGN
jgi:hypothetical protein